jgi:hypothetical protein
MRRDSASHCAGMISVLATFENCSVSMRANFVNSGTLCTMSATLRVPAR